ncbi:MAG: AAA family ATPase [Planctomycetota bacterium]
MEQPEAESAEGGQPFSVGPLADIDPMPEDDRWLIDGFLTSGSVTVLGAPPKTGKSWLTLALALTLAAGRTLLGDFHTRAPGRVLLYPAEDDPRSFRSRMEALCLPLGLKLGDLPIDILQTDQLLLDDPEHQARLEAMLHQVRPRLLVLDPLVRLHSGPESSSSHISSLFGYLRALQRRFDLAVLVTHHVAKSAGAKSGVGSSLCGSGDIHASYDHGALLRRVEDGSVILELEHRSAPAPEPLRYRLANLEGGGVAFVEVEGADEVLPQPVARSSKPKAPKLQVVKQAPKPDRKEQVLAQLRFAGGPVSQRQLREVLGGRNADLGALLHELADEGLIQHVSRNVGWELCTPTDETSPL